MSNEISKTDYLKRYLENDKKSDRKRKKSRPLKPKANISRLKIIDEDIDLKSINFGEGEGDIDDENPVVAEVIDERPLEEKLKELYDPSRWKKINSEEVSQSSSTEVFGNSNFKSGVESFKQLSMHDSSSNASHQKNEGRNHRKRHDSDDDISPPRSLKQNKYKTMHDSDDDISPPRSLKHNKFKTMHDSDDDISPPRSLKQNKYKNRHDSDSDISPPRHRSLHKSSSQSKSKSRKQNSDSYISPPRHEIVNKLSPVKLTSRKRNSDSDISPPRKKLENKSNSQRKNAFKKHDFDGDISPPHHHTQNKSNTHLKNSSKRHDSDIDEEFSNHQSCKSSVILQSDSDISPPRSSSELSNIKGKNKKLSKTLSGLSAGLQNSETLQKEVQELKQREKMQLSMLDDGISGRNADTVIRDRKTGMKRDLNKEQVAKAEENKKTKEYEQKYNKWGKGIEQAENKLEKFKDDLYEMSKPLARYRDDEDLDERLKSVIHDDDPMAEYIKKKRRKNAPNVPTYSGPPAPLNRFGILPGYRWDGVDRSNGFEKKYIEKINATKAVQDEAYLWSVQDM